MVLIRFEIQVFDFFPFYKNACNIFCYFFRLNSSHLHLMVHWAGEGSPVIFVLARSQVMDKSKIFKIFRHFFWHKILSISFLNYVSISRWQNVIFSSRSYLKNFHLQRLWKEFQRKFTFVQAGNWWKRSYSQILPPSTE